MLRSTYVMTNADMKVDGIDDTAKTPTARVKAVFTRGALTVGSISMPFGITNVSNQPDLTDKNDGAKAIGTTTKSFTFTYPKKYVVKTTSSSATTKLSKYYATNPNGQKGGKGVTISSPSDFKDSMIIAQGVANDDPRIFRGSHEAPVYDTYALYAAWDDTNLYLGWQFVNVTDVVDPAQGYPISDNGKPWNGDIPQMLLFNLGKGKTADMSKGNMAGGAARRWSACSFQDRQHRLFQLHRRHHQLQRRRHLLQV